MGYYLFAILPNINTTLTILTTICAISCVPITVAIVAYHMDGIDDFKFFKKIFKEVAEEVDAEEKAAKEHNRYIGERDFRTDPEH